MPPHAPYLFPEGSRMGADNLLLHAHATRHRVSNFAGPLSIKTVIAGEVSWIVGGRELLVDSSSFLILSAGEPYSMDIQTAKPVETCCAFFAPGFVERVALDSTTPLEAALDEPDRTAPALPYLSALHGDPERALSTRVQSLARRCRQMLAPMAGEEDFLLLAEALLRYYEKIRAEIARVPATRPSTRDELFRRLLRGREYLHAQQSGAASLAAAARAACLSPFHFHRGFSRAFEQTPHAYVTGLRLDRARRRLEAGSPVINAALEVGFSSPSAFSRLFRVYYGEPPSAVRRKFARLGKNTSAESRTLRS
jgi:AraC-like DNA-binding protein